MSSTLAVVNFRLSSSGTISGSVITGIAAVVPIPLSSGGGGGKLISNKAGFKVVCSIIFGGKGMGVQHEQESRKLPIRIAF